MQSLMPRAVLILSVLVSGTPSTSLESFQAEAERALQRSIIVIDVADMGSNLGETFCDQNPVLIRIRMGLDEKLHEKVLAHELGHALICGQGILNRTDSIPPFDGPLSIVPALGAGIGSCYIDPLADAEAEKRGFSEAETTDEFFRRSISHSRNEINDFFDKYGVLAADFAALTIYCVDLRPHSFKIKALESQLSDKPYAMARLASLRHELGKPQCSDPDSCFVLTRHLRDQLGLQRSVKVMNPTTRQLE